MGEVGLEGWVGMVERVTLAQNVKDEIVLQREFGVRMLRNLDSILRHV